jgi:hypothetical protein
MKAGAIPPHPGLRHTQPAGEVGAVNESTKAVGFARTHAPLAKAVRRVNAELARLHALGITVDPTRIRYGGVSGEHGTSFVASFGYFQPVTAEEPS